MGGQYLPIIIGLPVAATLMFFLIACRRPPQLGGGQGAPSPPPAQGWMQSAMAEAREVAPAWQLPPQFYQPPPQALSRGEALLQQAEEVGVRVAPEQDVGLHGVFGLPTPSGPPLPWGSPAETYYTPL